jgi:hypothetical protein
MKAGDAIDVEIRADFVATGYVWTWRSRISDPSTGAIKADYRQSTFLGTSFSPARLRKRADGFVPCPSPDAHVDRRVLELMGGNLSLGEIAGNVWKEFPARFKDRNAALERVADLSERYCQS